MARPLRIDIEGAFYHITSRGNEKRDIFFSEEDYDKFIIYLKKAKGKYRFLLHCYVLMCNHYHLLLETPQANLGKIMHFINSSYSNYINRKRERIGHLFQGRFKSILVDSESYFLRLSIYLHLNPVRAKIVEKPEFYPYSSYIDYIDARKNDLVSCNLILDMIPKNKNEQDAKCIYKLLVEEEIKKEEKNPLNDIYAGMILGKENFIKKILEKHKNEISVKKEITSKNALTSVINAEDISCAICNYFQISKQSLIENKKREYKKIAIYLMKKYTDLTSVQIGIFFGSMSNQAVMKAYQRYSREVENNSSLKSMTVEIIDKMSNVRG